AYAYPHFQTLVGLGIVGGSNGYLEPGANIDRAAIAKLLVEVYPLDKALLVPRLDLIS
ncbi:MAG: S-layer homology domain-containing protein, partial [Oscillospiraceae bacterium]|nr:S-layer homology domain-containing protein [Oscillospiraceae bacterium]